ncbi:MAG: bifunctional metallophosphatase/5'-nucleotidase [Candidatus Hodarchaeales archaeon]|jgi:2',3'-cyclic-nucleotide 2'-phosphodiesterase (5'-nucleotidase family)
MNIIRSQVLIGFSNKEISLIVVFFLCTNFSLLFSASNLANAPIVQDDHGLSFKNLSSTASDTVNLTLLHINDLHGWLNPHDGYGGVASYMGYFNGEGFDPSIENSSFLLLSGGDQNTGPATATLSKGEAVIDVMNTMGFDAAAIGNHEFDFGVESMVKRKEQANFPLLSSNIFNVGTSDLANFTVPWVIQNHSGINVGIVGLTTRTTYTSAHPKYTSHFDFGDYEIALRANVPAAQAAGADLIVVLAHCTPNTLSQLATDVSDLGITAFLGGHGGTPTVEYVGDSIVAMAAHKSKQYVKLEISVNRSTKDVLTSTGGLYDNIDAGVTPDSDIQTLVDQWDAQINASEVITYTSEDIFDSSGDSGIGALITDAFIYYFDYRFNFGFTNRGGGFRDYFRQGDITIADVVSVNPFENTLMTFNMTGEELEDNSYFSNDAVSGLRKIDDRYFIQENGAFEPLNYTKIYTGIVPDYIWYVQYKDIFAVHDTGVHYRDTVISYFRQLDDLALHDDVNRTLIPLKTDQTTTTNQLTTSSEIVTSHTVNSDTTDPQTTTGVNNSVLMILLSIPLLSMIRYWKRKKM